MCFPPFPEHVASLLVGLFSLFLSFGNCVLAVSFFMEKDLVDFFIALIWTSLFLLMSMLLLANAIM